MKYVRLTFILFFAGYFVVSSPVFSFADLFINMAKDKAIEYGKKEAEKFAIKIALRAAGDGMGFSQPGLLAECYFAYEDGSPTVASDIFLKFIEANEDKIDVPQVLSLAQKMSIGVQLASIAGLDLGKFRNFSAFIVEFAKTNIKPGFKLDYATITHDAGRFIINAKVDAQRFKGENIIGVLKVVDEFDNEVKPLRPANTTGGKAESSRLGMQFSVFANNGGTPMVVRFEAPPQALSKNISTLQKFKYVITLKSDKTNTQKSFSSQLFYLWNKQTRDTPPSPAIQPLEFRIARDNKNTNRQILFFFDFSARDLPDDDIESELTIEFAGNKMDLSKFRALQKLKTNETELTTIKGATFSLPVSIGQFERDESVAFSSVLTLRHQASNLEHKQNAEFWIVDGELFLKKPVRMAEVTRMNENYLPPVSSWQMELIFDIVSTLMKGEKMNLSVEMISSENAGAPVIIKSMNIPIDRGLYKKTVQLGLKHDELNTADEIVVLGIKLRDSGENVIAEKKISVRKSGGLIYKVIPESDYRSLKLAREKIAYNEPGMGRGKSSAFTGDGVFIYGIYTAYNVASQVNLENSRSTFKAQGSPLATIPNFGGGVRFQRNRFSWAIEYEKQHYEAFNGALKSDTHILNLINIDYYLPLKMFRYLELSLGASLGGYIQSIDLSYGSGNNAVTGTKRNILPLFFIKPGIRFLISNIFIHAYYVFNPINEFNKKMDLANSSVFNFSDTLHYTENVYTNQVKLAAGMYLDW